MTTTDEDAIEQTGDPALPADQIDSYEVIVELVRRGVATTRPELGRRSGLGRSIVAERIDQAVSRGIISEASPTGAAGRGRPSRQLRFVSERAGILVASFGALGVGVALADLSGEIISSSHGPWSIEEGPEASLGRLVELFGEIRAAHPDLEIWGAAVGVPGPVEFATGHVVMPPIMPGWNDFDVRGWLSERIDTPVWVDNDANLMALGQLSQLEIPRGEADLMFVKIGTGIGAGLVSGGRLHRGSNGGAGDIGHVAIPGHGDVICRCGQRGCLEAVAGGWAVARDGAIAAADGSSAFLAQRLESEGIVRPKDVVEGSLSGDAVCVDLIVRSASVLGEHIAGLVSFFNPAVIALGGVMASAGDLYLATVRRAVYERSLVLSTRDLQIISSTDDADLALRGGARLVIDQLFGRGRLRNWFAEGSPTLTASAVYRPTALAL